MGETALRGLSQQLLAICGVGEDALFPHFKYLGLLRMCLHALILEQQTK